MKQDDVIELFDRIPILDGMAPGDFEITPLPGYTNRNLRLRNREHDWVLRVPRAATDRFVDRAAEAHNQSIASDLGLAPLPLWRDASGLTLTPTLGAGRAIEQADFSDPETLRAILAPVSALHRSGARFRGRVDLHQLLLRYYALLAKPVQARFADRLRAARLGRPGASRRRAHRRGSRERPHRGGSRSLQGGDA